MLLTIIALGAGALIVAMLAIAFLVPHDDVGPTPPTSQMARPQAPPIRLGPTPAPGTGSRPRTPPTGEARAERRPRAPTVHGAAQAWQSAEHSVRSQVERFLVLLESDRRSVRQFRLEHPDTIMVLFSGVAAIVLGVLVAALVG